MSPEVVEAVHKWMHHFNTPKLAPPTPLMHRLPGIQSAAEILRRSADLCVLNLSLHVQCLWQSKEHPSKLFILVAWVSGVKNIVEVLHIWLGKKHQDDLSKCPQKQSVVRPPNAANVLLVCALRQRWHL